MVTLLLVTDLSWASNILVRSIVSASNERNGAPSGNNPKTFQRSCEVGKRVVRHVESIGSIMPTRPIMLGKDKVVDRANRLIVVSDRG